MSSLLHNLGLSKDLSFHDVYSIDDPDLLAFVPRPAHALLLVFPVSDTYERFRTQEDADKEKYEGHGSGEEVMWYKQTIGNACGLIGVLHGVSNGEARNHVGESRSRRGRTVMQSQFSDCTDLNIQQVKPPTWPSC